MFKYQALAQLNLLIADSSYRNTTQWQWKQKCDWASKNGPSGHTKFDHIFHICCIITNSGQFLS